MSIDQKTVKYISKLARISINEKKAVNLAKDLTNIFKFIEKLNKLDTKNIEPLTSIAETKLYLREDNIKDGNIRDQILENSPQKNKEFFVVPKVIE